MESLAGLHATALKSKIGLHANRSAPISIQIRRHIERNPQKLLSNTPGGVQASASQPPNPHWNALGGAEQKTTSFPIYAGGLYIICVPFLFYFLF